MSPIIRGEYYLYGSSYQENDSIYSTNIISYNPQTEEWINYDDQNKLGDTRIKNFEVDNENIYMITTKGIAIVNRKTHNCSRFDWKMELKRKE